MASPHRNAARIGATAIMLGVLQACGGGGGSDIPSAATGSALGGEVNPGNPGNPPVVVLPVPTTESPSSPASPAPAPAPSPSPSPVPIGPDGVYPERGDPVMGVMGELAPWGNGKLVPLHVAITSDGRVLAYGRDADFASEMIYDIWDWRLGIGPDSHLVLPNRVGTDLFCSNQMLLTTGEMLITGGDMRINATTGNVGNQTNRGSSDANIFNDKTNAITRRSTMNEPRWYGTVTMLPWGEVFIQGGAIDVNADDPALYTEIGSEDGSSFRRVTGFKVDDLPWYYPRNFAAPTGEIVGFAHNYTYRLDPRGNGTRRDTGHMPQLELNNGSVAAMYRPGKVLIGGGGNAKMMRVDIRGATPAYQEAAPMSAQRLWGMATVLPNGHVLVGNGGTTDTSITGAGIGVPARHVEIYNPDTNTWTIGASSQRARLYHSTTLLLPNATVLIGGGGLPGPVTNPDAEIYYPPYLFKADGSLAPRPVISKAPTVVNPASSFEVESVDAANIGSVALVKTGAATHSFDMDQRFVPASFTRSGNTLQVSLPAEAGVTPPGFYHLFLLDKSGVPSVSRIMRMNKFEGALTPPPVLGVETALVGGAKGLRRELGCAPEEVLTGLHGRAYDRVYRLGAVCTPIDKTTGAWNGASIKRATSGDQYVDANAPASGLFDVRCPANQAVAGYSGGASANGEYIGRIELSCRPLSSGGTVIGSPFAATAIGTAAAGTTATCPDNKPAVGVTGLANYDGFYRFGLRCGG